MSEEINEAAPVAEEAPSGLGLAPEPVAQETTDSAPVSDESTYSEFYDSLPDELKQHDSLRNTKSLHSLADQLVNAQSALGTKRLQAPQEDWGDDEWTGFYDQIRPKDSEYSIPDELKIEGFEAVPDLPEEATQELVDFAGDMGLNQQQFDKLYSRYMKMGLEGQAEMDTSAQNKINELRTDVQVDWGDKYETNLKQANQAYEALTSEIPELKELVESDPVMANHPAVLKLFHRISEVAGDTLPLANNNPASGFTNQNVHGVKTAIQELDTDNASLIMSNPSELSMSDRTKRQQVLEKRCIVCVQLDIVSVVTFYLTLSKTGVIPVVLGQPLFGVRMQLWKAVGFVKLEESERVAHRKANF